jgi:flagellar motor protein MotB
MSGRQLFQEGSADLRQDAEESLATGCSLLDGINPYIRVEVSTNEIPAEKMRHSDSWDLAVARSASIAQYIASREREASQRISVSGYGVARPVIRKGRESPASSGGTVEITLTLQKT